MKEREIPKSAHLLESAASCAFSNRQMANGVKSPDPVTEREIEAPNASGAAGCFTQVLP